MSQVTIQCRLVAKEAARQTLWRLMAGSNTPFINELLQRVAREPEFVNWRRQGKLKAGIVKQLGDELKQDSRFIGQPARFYTSGMAAVEYIFKSWLKLLQRLQRKLDGQIQWLAVLKSDDELVTGSNASLETIRARASEILSYASCDRLFNRLFEAYENEEDGLDRAALVYLLKNRCKVPETVEDIQKFALYRRKIEITIARLQQQIDARLPQGRDLTYDRWLETLALAATTNPKDEPEAKSWQDVLLTKPQTTPFPINYETNEDLKWSKNEKGRLCVTFNGLSELNFQIYCDRRQLKWFQRFYEDQETKKASKDKHSSALFALRSGRILWQEGTGRGEPWNIHKLTLQCALDTRLWTQEGTERVRQEKAGDIAKTLTRMQEKEELNKNQQAFIKRKQTTLDRLGNSYSRPSKPLYQPRSNIVVGVSMGLSQPATVAIVDLFTQNALTYRNIKQLLGDNYFLLNRQRQQKQRQSHQRSVAQRKEAFNQFGDSELGQYIDRLLAKAIVALAEQYRAESIVTPKLEDMREIVQSEIQARAERKIPNCIEAQAQYAKSYRLQVHQWSYGRLIDNIQAQASKLGIMMEQSQQPVRGSPQQQARELAIAAYASRNSA
jgi:transposase